MDIHSLYIQIIIYETHGGTWRTMVVVEQPIKKSQPQAQKNMNIYKSHQLVQVQAT